MDILGAACMQEWAVRIMNDKSYVSQLGAHKLSYFSECQDICKTVNPPYM